jgi:hypothetical protein
MIRALMCYHAKQPISQLGGLKTLRIHIDKSQLITPSQENWKSYYSIRQRWPNSFWINLRLQRSLLPHDDN